MAGVQWLIDTNVLLNWVYPHTLKHSATVEAIRKMARQSTYPVTRLKILLNSGESARVRLGKMDLAYLRRKLT